MTNMETSEAWETLLAYSQKQGLPPFNMSSWCGA